MRKNMDFISLFKEPLECYDRYRLFYSIRPPNYYPNTEKNLGNYTKNAEKNTFSDNVNYVHHSKNQKGYNDIEAYYYDFTYDEFIDLEHAMKSFLRNKRKKELSYLPLKQTKILTFSQNQNLIDLVSITNRNNNAWSVKSTSKEYVMSQSKVSGIHSKASKTSIPDITLDIKNMQESLLKSHNKYRELHNVPLLQYCDELEKSAQMWAETLAVVLVLAYSPENDNYSENCAEVRNPHEFKVEDITALWYSQETFYDYEDSNHRGAVDQFCVLIWNSTRKVGFGIAKSKDKRLFVVAHYSPPGLIGDLGTNVKPPKGYIKPIKASKPFEPMNANMKSYKGIKKEELKEFQMDALGKLNNFRLRHHSPALILNDDLCKSALEQAKRSATNQMLLTKNEKDFGETYLELTIENFTITGGLSPRHWYGESLGYEYNLEPTSDQYHNFTQLVWKNSVEMGIGVAASLDGVLYVIAHYTPPGNIPNQYLTNVIFPKEEIKFCPCGCGYLSPACIQDLTTTIISRLPSNLVSQRSRQSKCAISVRSFSVLDSVHTKKRDTQKSGIDFPKIQKTSSYVGEIQTSKSKELASVHSVKKEESKNMVPTSSYLSANMSMQKKETLKSIPNTANTNVQQSYVNIPSVRTESAMDRSLRGASHSKSEENLIITTIRKSGSKPGDSRRNTVQSQQVKNTPSKTESQGKQVIDRKSVKSQQQKEVSALHSKTSSPQSHSVKQSTKVEDARRSTVKSQQHRETRNTIKSVQGQNSENPRKSELKSRNSNEILRSKESKNSTQNNQSMGNSNVKTVDSSKPIVDSGDESENATQLKSTY